MGEWVCVSELTCERERERVHNFFGGKEYLRGPLINEGKRLVAFLNFWKEKMSGLTERKNEWAHNFELKRSESEWSVNFNGRTVRPRASLYI